MKAKILLTASIILNVALAIGYFTQRVEPRAPSQPAVEALATSPGASVPLEEGRAEAPVPVPNWKPTGVTNAILDWTMVESPDYKQYIQNLRAIGCPEETIQDIIIADVDKLFKARAESRNTNTNKFEYWKIGNPLAALLNEELIAQSQKSAQEKRALLKELLGVDVNRPDLAVAFNPFEQLLDFLPQEKTTALMEMEQKYAAKLMKTVKAAQQGNMDGMLAVQAEKDAELEALLGPADKLEYDLRVSQTAVLMRMRMTEFQPSEEEFREMFELQKAFDDKYGPYGNPPRGPENREAWDQAKKDLADSMETVLGGERYREYRYDQDWSQSSLRSVAEDFEIPKERALQVFDIRDTAREEATRVRNDAGLSSDQRQSALDLIRSTTEQEIGRLIGNEAAQEYVRRGSWIKGLNK